MRIMERAEPGPETAVRAAAGDGAAFRALVDAWRGRVHGFCWRMSGNAASAEDLAQEVFLHLFQVLRRYDPARPFAPWMRRVMTNVVLNRLRARPRRTLPLEGPGEGPLLPVDPRATDPREAAAAREDAARVRAAVAALPEAWRVVVVHRYNEGLPVADIAEALDVPVNTVKTRLFRARAALRAALEGPAEGEAR